MVFEYECLNCGEQFTADELVSGRCPTCDCPDLQEIYEPDPEGELVF